MIGPVRAWGAVLLAAVLTVSIGQGQSAPTSRPASSQPADHPRRPNIILILTDDQAPGTLGFDGNTRIRTPNLDRMAREGVFLPRAYVPTPQCAPSRASIVTGLYPHDHGVTANVVNQLDRSIPTMASLLRESGYRCGLIGKWHLGSQRVVQGGFEDCWIVPEAKKSGPERYTRPTFFDRGQPRTFERFSCDAATDMALEFIGTGGDKPFLLWLSYCEPHTPLTAHPDHRYDPATLPDPPSSVDDLSSKPVAQREGYAHSLFRNTSEAARAEQRSRYYSMISAVDANVGRVLESLRERGLERDTLVIFVCDNGWLLGEHQMWSKEANFYEELVRSPMIFRQPGALPAGVRLDRTLACSFDLFPTLLRRAGLTPAADLPGIDLWPILSGSAAEPTAHEQVFLEFQAGNAVRPEHFEPMLGVVTLSHKYTRYLRSGEEELYDLAADRYEMRNLIHDAAAGSALKDLRARVEAFQRTIRKPFWIDPPRRTGPAAESGE